MTWEIVATQSQDNSMKINTDVTADNVSAVSTSEETSEVTASVIATMDLATAQTATMFASAIDLASDSNSTNINQLGTQKDSDSQP